MAMLSVASTGKPFQMNASNIKTEHSLDDSGRKLLERSGITPQVVPQSMKMVEILCLNKVYRGFGFRNEIGGLEFYNEDYREKMTANKRNILGEYYEEERRLKEEISSYEQAVRDGAGINASDTLRLIDMNTRLEQAQNELERLKEKVRSGQASAEEINKLRPKLITEINQLNDGIAALEGKVDDFTRKMREIPMLKLRLRCLQDKLEERSQELSVSATVSIGKQGILFFPKFEGITTLYVCVFSSFLDYLAYKTLCADETEAYILGLVRCDCIVMNNPANFTQMVLDTDMYDQVHCFFPNTAAGKVMERSIMSRHPNAISMAHIYEDKGCLYNYVNQPVMA